MKKVYMSLAAFLMASAAIAQESSVTKTFWDDPINDPMMPVYAVSAMVFIVLVLVLAVALYMVRIVNILIEQSEKDKAAQEGRVYVPRPSFWGRLSQKLNDSVPVSQEEDIDLGHNFDGIRELDNHLPPWWKWLFYGTIGWGAVYLVVYHISASFPLSIGEYDREIALAHEQAEKRKASQPAVVIDENALKYTADAAIIAKGKSVFVGNNCGTCHRADGGGNTIGPNLTDEFWIHGGGIKNVFSTIKNGAVEKGMPAWGKSMSSEDVRNVAFYVMSLQGRKPANGKAPQGDKYIPEKEAVAVDSVKTQASL
ncbi:MAG TPA: cbb3-type cytochrome c oxidase N-terminal domain-containing protein [Ohtaekwangia sp.]|uniref:cbb3-type cytochrome c oxidase N-terminal domain-containing protein n=1 Tax=Ohtaekwangia sp. TaxID=2066019 RepID=UPI002F95521C